MDNGHIDLSVIVLLALGGVAVYIAYKRPALGAAILVGVGVVGVLYILLFGQNGTPAPPPAMYPPPASTAASTPAPPR